MMRMRGMKRCRCEANTCICSYFQPSAPQFASQERVYQDIGVEMLDHAFQGKNSWTQNEWYVATLCDLTRA